MSMPAGFGTPAQYSLPTSFSGSFQQPTFPAQAAFPQQTAFSQQPNGKLECLLSTGCQCPLHSVMLSARDCPVMTVVLALSVNYRREPFGVQATQMKVFIVVL